MVSSTPALDARSTTPTALSAFTKLRALLTNRGICFPFKTNPNGLKTIDSCTGKRLLLDAPAQNAVVFLIVEFRIDATIETGMPWPAREI